MEKKNEWRQVYDFLIGLFFGISFGLEDKYSLVFPVLRVPFLCGGVLSKDHRGGPSGLGDVHLQALLMCTKYKLLKICSILCESEDSVFS